MQIAKVTQIHEGRCRPDRKGKPLQLDLFPDLVNASADPVQAPAMQQPIVFPVQPPTAPDLFRKYLSRKHGS